MKCSICFDDIYLPYFKNNCNCKVYYHLECINEWCKIKNRCILCKKKYDKKKLKKLKIIHNRIYQFFFNLMLISSILLIFILYLGFYFNFLNKLTSFI